MRLSSTVCDVCMEGIETVVGPLRVIIGHGAWTATEVDLCSPDCLRAYAETVTLADMATDGS